MEASTRQKHKTVAEELKHYIELYKKEHPSLSNKLVAKSLGVKSSTLDRIESLSIKTPSFGQVSNILIHSDNKTALVRYIENSYPQLIKLLKEKSIEESKLYEDSKEINNILKDGSKYKILLTIICRKKVTTSYIRETFGTHGIQVVKDLIGRGFVKKIDGDNITINCKGPLQITSSKELLDISLNIIKNSFDSDGATNKVSENHLGLNVSSLNAKKIIPILKNELNEAKVKIQKMIADPHFSGNDIIFLSLACDTVLPNNIRAEFQKNLI